MGHELFLYVASLGAKIPGWLRSAPGLRAIRLPQFGSDALRNLWIAMLFAAWCQVGEVYRGLACCLLCLTAGCYIVGRLIHLRQIWLGTKSDKRGWSLSCEVINQLPNTMLILWAVVHLWGNHLLWVNRIAGLVWLNYFAVGCAIAVRRGVVDFHRSRKLV